MQLDIQLILYIQYRDLKYMQIYLLEGENLPYKNSKKLEKLSKSI